MLSVADILALGLNAKPKTRAVSVCLDGDIEDRLVELRKQLLEAEEQDKASFSGGRTGEVVEQIRSLQDKAVAESLTFHLRKLPYLRPLELQAAHPPREDNADDATYGYNRESYFPALVRECCYEVSHPEGDVVPAGQLTDEWWDGVFTAVNYKQFDELFSAAYSINHQDSAAPFLRAASQRSQTSDGDSKRLEPGESPRNGSRAGNPDESPSTSTTPPGDSFGA